VAACSFSRRAIPNFISYVFGTSFWGRLVFYFSNIIVTSYQIRFRTLPPPVHYSHLDFISIPVVSTVNLSNIFAVHRCRMHQFFFYLDQFQLDLNHILLSTYSSSNSFYSCIIIRTSFKFFIFYKVYLISLVASSVHLNKIVKYLLYLKVLNYFLLLPVY
jgi:hypothetical protein